MAGPLVKAVAAAVGIMIGSALALLAYLLLVM